MAPAQRSEASFCQQKARGAATTIRGEGGTLWFHSDVSRGPHGLRCPPRHLQQSRGKTGHEKRDSRERHSPFPSNELKAFLEAWLHRLTTYKVRLLRIKYSNRRQKEKLDCTKICLSSFCEPAQATPRWQKGCHQKSRLARNLKKPPWSPLVLPRRSRWATTGTGGLLTWKCGCLFLVPFNSNFFYHFGSQVIDVLDGRGDGPRFRIPLILSAPETMDFQNGEIIRTKNFQIGRTATSTCINHKNLL